MEDKIKENLKISGKKLEIMSKRQLGVVLDDFVLKEKSQAIYETVEETIRRQQKRLMKSNRGKDKEEQEVRPTIMITTAAAVQEVCMVEGDRARERVKQRIRVRES